MLKALIVEDDKLLAASLKAAIAEKFDADVCYNGLDGQKFIDENVYDFVIADSILPGRGGIDLLDYIREEKELKIPVIGNGDVTSPELAKKMLDDTNCDAVMIGRAALGNPWMLYRTVKYLETGELTDEPTPREKIDVCLLHLRRLMEIKPDKVAVHEMRKHAAYYMKGIKGGAKVKKELNTLNTYSEMEHLFGEFLDFLESGIVTPKKEIII